MSFYDLEQHDKLETKSWATKTQMLGDDSYTHRMLLARTLIDQPNTLNKAL